MKYTLQIPILFAEMLGLLILFYQEFDTCGMGFIYDLELGIGYLFRI
jgi:hypothetical protein